jgi:hypothetical protein
LMPMQSLHWTHITILDTVLADMTHLQILNEDGVATTKQNFLCSHLHFLMTKLTSSVMLQDVHCMGHLWMKLPWTCRWHLGLGHNLFAIHHVKLDSISVAGFLKCWQNMTASCFRKSISPTWNLWHRTFSSGANCIWWSTDCWKIPLCGAGKHFFTCAATIAIYLLLSQNFLKLSSKCQYLQ